MALDKREHLRLPVATKIFIELVSPSMDSSDSGKIAMCETQNVSRGGLQVGMQHKVTVGAILQIGVQMSDEDDALYLAGEVEWCRPSHDAGMPYSAGFRVLNANNSDIELWVSLLTAMDT